MKMKVIIFLVLNVFVTLLNAQSLKAFLYTANYNTPDNNPFIECYFSFEANSMTLIEDENKKYYGELDIYLEITSEGNLIYHDHYKLKSPYFKDSVANNLLFIDQKRIAIENGLYLLTIKMRDIHTNSEALIYNEKILMDFQKDKIAFSDISLIEQYKKTINENKLSKNGYDLIPYVSNFYPSNHNTLSFYFEIYNTDKYFNSDKRYLLNTYIESFETNVVLFDFSKSKRMIAKEIESNLFSFPIGQLPTGNYNLVCQIRDSKNNAILQKKLFFQRSSIKRDKSRNDISSVNIDGTFVDLITNIDSMLLYIDYLYPISTILENTFTENQKRYNDLLLMQKFFLNFWKGRNHFNPEQEWKKYYRIVKSVNKEFRNAKLAGYKTDRGRVYLQYGSPNSRHKVDNSSANLPYEIWHYYKLDSQTDCKFVFVNEHLGMQDYRLTYSNVEGEVSNQEWRDRLEQDGNPTFGDDFINNYINPR
ncbi:MAG: GWxTD domain-containing protein [Bacteroidota bacterium]|nr:GWxTD domain-containing protein [Bacteroidota bacterium]